MRETALPLKAVPDETVVEPYIVVIIKGVRSEIILVLGKAASCAS